MVTENIMKDSFQGHDWYERAGVVLEERESVKYQC